MSRNQNIKYTAIGVLPSDWDVMTIEDVCDVKTGPFGSALHAKDYVAQGTPIITVEHIGNTRISHSRNIPQVSDIDKKRLSAYVLKEGDIVFSRVGSIDRSSIVTEQEDGWLFSGRLLRLRKKNGVNFCPLYLCYHLNSEGARRRIVAKAVGQTMPSLNTQILNQIEIALPSYECEQSRIAEALSSVEGLILDLERAIRKKKSMKLGAMQQLLSGKVRLKGFSTPWVEVELRQTGVMKSGGTPSTLVSEYWNGNINWLQSGAVQNCYIYPSAVSQKITELGLSKSAAYLISHDSVLIALTGATCANVGYLTFDSAANQSVVSIEPYPEYSAKFLYQLLLTKRDLILQNRGGSAQGGVSLNQLKGITVTLPIDLEEQVEIAAILSAMDNEIAALEAERDKYKNIKQGMMQQLLTGQIRLPV